MASIDADHHEIIAVEPDTELCKYLLSFFNQVDGQRQALGSQALLKGKKLSVQIQAST
jgi:hypothetical protein